MKTPDKLDIGLQTAILKVGQALAARSSRHGVRSRSTGSPDALLAETERVLGLVRQSPARKLVGIKANFVTEHDAIRLLAFAYVAWEMVSEVSPCTSIETVAAAIADPTKILCEQLLVVRDVLGLLVCERRLILSLEGGGWSGRLVLPQGVFSWIVGSPKSHGDFDPSKIDSARLNRNSVDDGNASRKSLPTARQLYEAVLTEVVGVDSVIRVMASRFALHAIRAEAMKAGSDCTEVPQMVVVLIADSGAGKSYTVSRFAKHLGLGLCQYDATVLTAQGYVGADLDEPYRLLVNSVGGDADEAARGIVFLDEFSAKGTRHNGRDGGRDVSTLAIQQELLCKLQSNAPFVVGGKRQFDNRPFLFDGRKTGYILGGTFDGLDEIIRKMEGRKDIGFASEAGCRKFVTIQSALVEAGYIRPLVNRISTVVRLPTPTVQNVEFAIARNIIRGFNEVLLPQGIVLEATESAAHLMAGYAVESGGYYRAAKAVLAVLVEDYLFDFRGGTVSIEVPDVRRGIERLSSGIVLPDDKPAVGVAEPSLDGDADVLPEQAGG